MRIAIVCVSKRQPGWVNDAFAASTKRMPRELRVELVQLEMRIGRYSGALDHMAPLGPEFDGLRGTALHVLGRYEEALEFLAADQLVLAART